MADLVVFNHPEGLPGGHGAPPEDPGYSAPALILAPGASGGSYKQLRVFRSAADGGDFETEAPNTVDAAEGQDNWSEPLEEITL